MGHRLSWLFDFGRSIDIEVREIAYETETGILVEWRSKNAWLPKSRIKIQRKAQSIIVTVPRSLYRTKF